MRSRALQPPASPRGDRGGDTTLLWFDDRLALTWDTKWLEVRDLQGNRTHRVAYVPGPHPPSLAVHEGFVYLLLSCGHVPTRLVRHRLESNGKAQAR